jgi:hypothetical protein
MHHHQNPLESTWVIEFFSIYLILPTALGPSVYSVSKRNEQQPETGKKKKFLGSGG